MTLVFGKHMCTHVPAYARREIYGPLPSCREAISSAVNLKLCFLAPLFLHLSTFLCAGRKVLERASRLVPAGSRLPFSSPFRWGLLRGTKGGNSHRVCGLQMGTHHLPGELHPGVVNSSVRGEGEAPSQVPPREEL